MYVGRGYLELRNKAREKEEGLFKKIVPASLQIKVRLDLYQDPIFVYFLKFHFLNYKHFLLMWSVEKQYI